VAVAAAARNLSLDCRLFLGCQDGAAKYAVLSSRKLAFHFPLSTSFHGIFQLELPFGLAKREKKVGKAGLVPNMRGT